MSWRGLERGLCGFNGFGRIYMSWCGLERGLYGFRGFGRIFHELDWNANSCEIKSIMLCCSAPPFPLREIGI